MPSSFESYWPVSESQCSQLRSRAAVSGDQLQFSAGSRAGWPGAPLAGGSASRPSPATSTALVTRNAMTPSRLTSHDRESPALRLYLACLLLQACFSRSQTPSTTSIFIVMCTDAILGRSSPRPSSSISAFQHSQHGEVFSACFDCFDRFEELPSGWASVISIEIYMMPVECGSFLDAVRFSCSCFVIPHIRQFFVV